jgi:hypothetical protein
VLLAGTTFAAWALLGNDVKAPSAGTGADAGTDTDAGADAGTGAGAGADPLTPHEREEAAKDELARARKALQDGDVEAAEAALDRATTYDPSNPDIEVLRSELLGHDL